MLTKNTYIKILFSILLIIISLSSSSLIASSTFGPTYGPVQEDDFETIFIESLAEQQEIIFYSRAIWYPNKNGFKFLPAGKKSRKGVIVYTEQAIYFSEWKAKSYELVFMLDYSEVAEFRLAANDLFGRIVVKKDNYNSFEILGVNGPDLPDKEETEVAYEIIAKLKSSN